MIQSIRKTDLPQEYIQHGVKSPLPEPEPWFNAHMIVRVGFKEIEISVATPLLATDIHDNLANVQREVDQAIYRAFKELT